MQPHTTEIIRGQRKALQLFLDCLGNQWRHLFEYLTALLNEELVRFSDTRIVGAVQKPEIVPDVIREFGFQTGTEDLEALAFTSIFFTLNQNSRTGVTENKVTVPIAEVQVARTDLRADHQNGTGTAILDRINGGLEPERSGAAGYVHIVGKPVDTQRLLDLDRNGWVGSLQIRAGNNHRINILSRLARLFQRLTARRHGHVALNRGLFVAAIRDIGFHAVGIENAILVDDMATLDSRRFFDERRGGRLQWRYIAAGDGVCVLGVEKFNILVKGFDQFVITNGCWRCVETGPANNGFNHANPTS